MGTCRICGAEGLICVSAYDSPCSWCRVCGGINGEEFEEPSPSQAWVDLKALRDAAAATIEAINSGAPLSWSDLRFMAEASAYEKRLCDARDALLALLPPATAKEET